MFLRVFKSSKKKWFHCFKYTFCWSFFSPLHLLTLGFRQNSMNKIRGKVKDTFLTFKALWNLWFFLKEPITRHFVLNLSEMSHHSIDIDTSYTWRKTIQDQPQNHPASFLAKVWNTMHSGETPEVKCRKISRILNWIQKEWGHTTFWAKNVRMIYLTWAFDLIRVLKNQPFKA